MHSSVDTPSHFHHVHYMLLLWFVLEAPGPRLEQKRDAQQLGKAAVIISQALRLSALNIDP